MLCVCSNRGFVEVGDSKPKVVIEMSDKQHSILLSIATGIALEKFMVSFLVLIFFLLENAIWSKLYFPCWKNEISVMLWIFFFLCGWESSEEGERSMSYYRESISSK